MAEEITCDKPDPKCILRGVYFGKDVIRDGHIIVNHTGESIYIDIVRITPEELEAIKKHIARLEE
jgi:alpha-D-ribose 1-methylphosphonate 5-triphosphate synthase subunit PhnL